MTNSKTQTNATQTASLADLKRLVNAETQNDPKQAIFTTALFTAEQINAYSEYLHEFALHLGYITALIDRGEREGVERIALSENSTYHIIELTKMKGFKYYV